MIRLSATCSSRNWFGKPVICVKFYTHAILSTQSKSCIELQVLWLKHNLIKIKCILIEFLLLYEIHCFKVELTLMNWIEFTELDWHINNKFSTFIDCKSVCKANLYCIALLYNAQVISLKQSTARGCQRGTIFHGNQRRTTLWNIYNRTEH